MGVIKLEYNLGLISETYNRLLASLPTGEDNITADIVVPTHTSDRPVTLKVSGLTANTPYIFHVMAESQNADSPTIGFVPTSDVQYLPVQLSHGYNNVLILDNQGNQSTFRIAVAHYAVFFQAESEQITNYSWVPIKNLENNVQSEVGYILANPLISTFNKYIPTDLEILAVLANKLLVKNMLWRPGTDAGIDELLAAFSASHPVIMPMKNLGIAETPLYRGEEDFAGYEAHVWLPNREVERWRTFLQYINNLPQLFSLVQINEGEVFIKQGDTLHRHVFDFESDFANTVLEGVVGSTCFERIFRFSLVSEKEIFMGFCQASYPLDNSMPALLTPDTDLLAVTKFQDWSLSGRFEKQYDISYNKHKWVYEIPTGNIDSVNRFFDLSQVPATHSALKLFLDGLLLRYLVDYHISIEDDFRSGVYPIASSLNPMILDIPVGTPRRINAPVFSSIEIMGGVNTQFLVTANNQTDTNLSFIISSPPILGPQEAKLHYITPDLAASSYGGKNQYGTASVPIGVTNYNLVFPTPALDFQYQLFVQLGDEGNVGDEGNETLSVVGTTSGAFGLTFNYDKLAQKFTPLYGGITSEVTVRISVSQWAGGSTNLLAQIQAVDNGLPSGIPLATTEPFAVTSVIPDVDVTLNFSSTVSLQAGTEYFLVLSYAGLQIGSEILFTSANTDTGYIYSINTGLWSSQNYWSFGYSLVLQAQVATQIDCIVRSHTTTSALIEFSDATTNTKLHWWLLEENNIALENDSVSVPNGSDTLEITFLEGPYFEEVVVLIQLWNTEAISPVSIPLISFTNKTAFSMEVQFSETLGDNYIIDYAIFPSAAGNHIVMHYPPVTGQVLECQYDTEWEHWSNVGPIEQNDGLRKTFTLPTRCPIHEALYTTLDGRVLVQGYNQQYTVLDDTQIQLNFTPQLGQQLWFSYPTADLTGKAPESSWHQGYLTRQGTYQGSYAKCDIYNDGVVKAGDSITISGDILLGVAGAIGTVNVTSKINEFDNLTFVESAITFKAVSYTTYTNPLLHGTFSADADVDTINNSINLINHGIINNQLIYLYFTGNTPTGITPLTRYFVAETTLNSFKLSTSVNGGNIIDISGIGTGLGYVASGALPTEFPCLKSLEEDAQALTTVINNYDAISTNFLASYSSSIITIKARKPNFNQTLTKVGASLTVSNITGGVPLTKNEQQLITFSTAPSSGKFALQFAEYKTSYINYNETAAVIQSTIRLIPHLNDVVVAGNFATGFTLDFEKTAGSKSQPLFSVVGPSHTFDPINVNGFIPNTIYKINHGYYETQPVTVLTTGTLPAGLLNAKTYYVHVVDENNIALSESVAGSIVTLTSGGTGTHHLYADTLYTVNNRVEITITRTIEGYGNRFLAGVSQSGDTLALADLIQSNINLTSQYLLDLTDGHISLISKQIGAKFNSAAVVDGVSIRATNFIGGTDAKLGLPMRAEKQFYHQEAPIVALDGISTRLYKGYGGVDIKFDTEPTKRQEPYMVSQVYPVEHHPLDSMEVNLPCAYPKGQYTQGLSAHLSDVEINVDQEGTLIRIVNNLPFQEAPTGVLDGVNCIFDLSLPSCAGQNSLLLWLDGILQPPTTYNYSVVAGHGRITFITPPESEQVLWAWYIPYGDACVYEHVVELTGTIDGSNQNFAIPNSPFADQNILLVFLDGLLNIQNIDYEVDTGNSSITFLGAFAPNIDPVSSTPQTLWAHFNEGVLAAEPWRQITVGTGDGVENVFTIPHLLTTELPTSKDSVIVAMDGLVQREGIDFTVEIGMTGFPTGQLTFTIPPEVGRIIQTVYITRAS